MAVPKSQVDEREKAWRASRKPALASDPDSLAASLFTTMIVPFQVCWDRIDRANTYGNRIASLWNEFTAQEGTYAAHVHVNNDGTGNISIALVRPLPSEIPFILGEFLYQLRAALDACVYELACMNTGERPPPSENTLEFPFCQPGKFKDAGWKIQPLTDEQRAIIEAVQPYNAPELPDRYVVGNWNRSLGILNDWARKDRHRKLHVVASWASNIQPLLVIPKETVLREFYVCNDMFILEDEGVVAEFKIAGWQRGMEIYANPNLSLDIVVNEIPAPCDDSDSLGNRLSSMRKAVQVVVDSLASTVGICPRENMVIRLPPKSI